jgi:carboxyl-terminal processing protease
LDNFSYIDLLAAYAQFFSAGQYEGFGVSTIFIAPDEFRFVSVFASSPAPVAGFAHGQQIVMLNGRTIANIETSKGVGELFAMTSLECTIRRPITSEFVVTVDKGLVTIVPLPQWRIIDLHSGTTVGYLELATFISTANAPFISIFEVFANAGVTDVILDWRYNGGGLVDTTELLGDFLSGIANDGQVFSPTLY